MAPFYPSGYEILKRAEGSQRHGENLMGRRLSAPQGVAVLGGRVPPGQPPAATALDAHACVRRLDRSWERSACADPEHPEIRVNSLQFYVCATVL